MTQEGPVDLTATHTVEEYIQSLVTENIELRAQLNAVTFIVIELLSKSKNMSEDQAILVFRISANDELLNRIEKHPLLVDAWKEKLKKVFGDLPGIKFES